MAPVFDRGFWLATIIVLSIFMLGAAVGHVRSMIAEHNFAPGNAGYIFWYDILAPAFLVVMYVAKRSKSLLHFFCPPAGCIHDGWRGRFTKLEYLILNQDFLLHNPQSVKGLRARCIPGEQSVDDCQQDLGARERSQATDCLAQGQ
jgi:hypothetical protein